MACKCACQCAKCVCCGYPNGAWQVISMQFLLFCGVALSWAALGDCKFVTTWSESVVEDDDLASVLPVGSGLGYFMFENAQGNCAWQDVRDWDQYETYYYDFLGNDWKVGRAFGVLAGSIGVFMWIWSLFLICLAHSRPCRYAAVAILLIMVIFQGLSFLPLNTNFCSSNEYNCSFSRSAGLSVGALLCYFFSGVLILIMKDYIGPTDADKDVVVAASEEAPAQQDEENPETEEDDDDKPEQDQVSDGEEEQDDMQEEEEEEPTGDKEEENMFQSAQEDEETPATDETPKGDESSSPEKEKQPVTIATNESIELPGP